VGFSQQLQCDVVRERQFGLFCAQPAGGHQRAKAGVRTEVEADAAQSLVVDLLLPGTECRAVAEVADEHRLATASATQNPDRFGVGEDADAAKERRHDELIRDISRQLLGAVLEEGFGKDGHGRSSAIKQGLPLRRLDRQHGD
jgi:hypothetical protein